MTGVYAMSLEKASICPPVDQLIKFSGFSVSMVCRGLPARAALWVKLADLKAVRSLLVFLRRSGEKMWAGLPTLMLVSVVLVTLLS